MKLRKLLCLLLALCMVFCLFGCNQSRDKDDEDDSQEKQESTITPLLYKVTDDKGNTIWLFGSIHVGYDYFYPLPDYVLDAYESSDAIAFELDMKAFEKDVDAQVDALSALVYADGSSIADHIDPELYAAAVEILKEYDSYMPAYDLYCPMLWESLLSQLLAEEFGLDSELGIDAYLTEKAYKDGKTILEVESAAFQYGMMANFSPELQAFLLSSAVDAFADLEASREDYRILVDMWTGGDEEAFAAYLASEDDEITDPEELKLYEEYNTAMVVERNIAMTDYAEEALASGQEVFICVGAAHVVGDGAMAQLLAERGYTVTLVK